ncbi:PREDICTED: uncharacterized protein LOC108781928 [Cyphomyrmex costatus]|uniref:uncharacterized protein LOC108781928 n=1 Tax=Cyphomyrmex costatus TaxID=456900 RepID=UPI000852449C|nr:PREDICTED: uncharacterized protein LOC108781928 [Cyphomyrmex costatus]
MEDQEFEPHQIWNMDETGFPTVPTNVGKIIAPRGLKRIGQAEAAERGTLVSMALAVNAAGNSVPPFFVFPRKNMQSYFMDSAPPTAGAACTESGWFQQPEFVKYLHHFIKYTNASADNKILLAIDNHISHLSIEAIDLAMDNGITMVSFPPHCSHKMQPLDVSIYGPVKGYYRTAVKDWQIANAGKAVEIRHIPGLACKALDQALTPANIKAGFTATGICPLNRNIFGSSDFVQAAQSDQRQTATLIERASDKENQRRICVLTVQMEITAHEEVYTSEPSTSIVSRSESLSSLLSDIGLFQQATPHKKSNRGRKPMKSAVLTSPDFIADLKDKKEKRDAAKKKEGRKRKKTNTGSANETATDQRASCKEKIIFIIGSRRCGFLHDLYEGFAS